MLPVRSRRSDGFVEPCLPSPAERPPAGSNWIHEIKHDGFRIMARRDSAGVRLFTRNGNDFTARFPLAVAAITALPAHSFLIDGEAIVTDDKGLAVFELIRRARNGGAAVLCAFDLIELDGADLRRAPIELRKHKLARLVRTPHPGIVINEHYDGGGDIALVTPVTCQNRESNYASRRRVRMQRGIRMRKITLFVAGVALGVVISV